MKIDKKQLKKIIEEETHALISEQFPSERGYKGKFGSPEPEPEPKAEPKKRAVPQSLQTLEKHVMAQKADPAAELKKMQDLKKQLEAQLNTINQKIETMSPAKPDPAAPAAPAGKPEPSATALKPSPYALPKKKAAKPSEYEKVAAQRRREKLQQKPLNPDIDKWIAGLDKLK